MKRKEKKRKGRGKKRKKIEHDAQDARCQECTNEY